MSSWLRSFRKSHYAGPVRMLSYYDAYRATIEDLLARPSVEVWVACNSDESDPEHELYGYVVVEKPTCAYREIDNRIEKPIIHYAYTKQLFRRKGVMRSCLKAAGVDPKGPAIYTFKTVDMAQIARSRPWQWNPKMARYPSSSPDSAAE